MEVNDNNGYNAGNPGAGSPGYSDTGAQGATPTPGQGEPDNQNGQPTTPGNADEVAKYKAEVQRLNKALIDARRQGNQNRNTPQGDQGADFNDPATQYGMAMKMATADLRSGLEDRLALYPELPQDVVSAIRRNPWGYTKQDSMLSLNVENALLDIEEQIADYVDSLSNQNNNGQPAQPGSGATPTPAGVNPNSPTEPAGGEPVENDWALPLDQLEKKANAIKAKNSTK